MAKVGGRKYPWGWKYPDGWRHPEFPKWRGRGYSDITGGGVR